MGYNKKGYLKKMVAGAKNGNGNPGNLSTLGKRAYIGIPKTVPPIEFKPITPITPKIPTMPKMPTMPTMPKISKFSSRVAKKIQSKFARQKEVLKKTLQKAGNKMP